MLDTLFALPAHPLIVHATVVFIPAASVTVAAAALWRRFRTWAGPLPLLLSLTSLVLVPMTVKSGESLARHVDRTALTHRHGDLGHSLLPWVVALTIASALLLWLHRKGTGPSKQEHRTRYRFTAAAIALLALLAATGAATHIVRIGHSGAEAAWTHT